MWYQKIQKYIKYVHRYMGYLFVLMLRDNNDAPWPMIFLRVMDILLNFI